MLAVRVVDLSRTAGSHRCPPGPLTGPRGWRGRLDIKMTEHMNFRPVGADYDLTRLANNICGTGGLRPATIFATRRESTLRGENQSRCLLIILAELEAQISAHARGR